MRAEPRTILYFIWNYYDILEEVFTEHRSFGIVKRERLEEILAKTDSDLENKLIDYKILKRINEDFEFKPAYYSLFETILHEFKPMLPETIEKYHYSISELYRKIKTEINEDKQLLSSRLNDLSLQISEFYDMVEKNTTSLLKETRELKANVVKIDYREKVHKASYWIENYIIPLNKILDINHSNSISIKLYEIGEFANNKRLAMDEDSLRINFEKLYNQLIQTNDDLLRQSKILTNELLPLIERIKTESIILTGWIEFLKKPEKYPVPEMIKSARNTTYSRSIYLNAREYFEQFEDMDNFYLEEDGTLHDNWIFNREAYRMKLEQKLPIENFFGWAVDTLETEYEKIETEKFFALMGLLFEEDFQLEVSDEIKTQKIYTDELALKVPMIKISKYGIS
jgi:hypothetical protein